MLFKVLICIPLLVLCRNSTQHNPPSSELSLLETHGAFLGSFSAIIFSEFGDKTFIIAAILAMKYSRNWVFIGSAGAMFLMTFISCFLGQFILFFLPELYMKIGAALLFFAFGGKALYEGYMNSK